MPPLSHAKENDTQSTWKVSLFCFNVGPSSATLDYHWSNNGSICRGQLVVRGILFYVAFCTIMAISRQKEARSRDYVLLLLNDESWVPYSAQYHRQHCILQAFEQYLHFLDAKDLTRHEFEPSTSEFRATITQCWADSKMEMAIMETLEVVSCYRDPQLQVAEKFTYLFNLSTNISKSWSLNTHFIPIKSPNRIDLKQQWSWSASKGLTL